MLVCLKYEGSVYGVSFLNKVHRAKKLLSMSVELLSGPYGAANWHECRLFGYLESIVWQRMKTSVSFHLQGSHAPLLAWQPVFEFVPARFDFEMRCQIQDLRM